MGDEVTPDMAGIEVILRHGRCLVQDYGYTAGTHGILFWSEMPGKATLTVYGPWPSKRPVARIVDKSGTERDATVVRGHGRYVRMAAGRYVFVCRTGGRESRHELTLGPGTTQ